jgi:hypothetical protein
MNTDGLVIVEIILAIIVLAIIAFASHLYGADVRRVGAM